MDITNNPEAYLIPYLKVDFIRFLKFMLPSKWTLKNFLLNSVKMTIDNEIVSTIKMLSTEILRLNKHNIGNKNNFYLQKSNAEYLILYDASLQVMNKIKLNKSFNCEICKWVYEKI